VRTRLTRLGAAIVWLLAAALISAGGAGIVVGMDHSPASGARPELTRAGDIAATAALDGALTDLEGIRGRVEALGVQARGALAALTGQDLETVEAAIAEGDAIVADVRARSAALSEALANVPGVSGPEARLVTSDAVRARHAAMTAALDLTLDLEGAWGRLTAGSIAAAQLSGLLADHDRSVAEAAGLGREGRYAEAIGRIDAADATMTEARRMRDRLANTVDVAVLDEWLRRNERYDSALRGLYAALIDSGGRITRAVREALDGEAAAKAQLPPDSRGLVVIMAEIGRGGLNGAVITIEEARGRLAQALAGLSDDAPDAPDE
jgi:hypothetical protein